MQKSLTLLSAKLPLPAKPVENGTLLLPSSSGSQVETVRYRSRLKDLYFRFFNPVEFERTRKMSDYLLKDKGMNVPKIITAIRQMLKEKKIPVLDIHGRSKGVHSTYRKLLKYDMDITRVYDMIAVRVLVDDIDSCYKALSAVHGKYKPVEDRVKDYIIRPKGNGYQSLHTTVAGPEKSLFEVQFRTKNMHASAEYGTAAHWLYDLVQSRQMREFFLPNGKIPAELEAHVPRQRKKGILRQALVEEAAILHGLGCLGCLGSREYPLLE
jgi:(p)ppGpp synthase/HD superfamily hydrolase